MISIKIEICEVFFNDVLLEKLLEEIAIWKQKLTKFMKILKNLQNCMLIRWKFHGKNAFCWVFLCVNDNKKLTITILK